MVSWLPYLLDLKLLLSFRHVATCAGFGVLHLRRRSSICHLDVGHDGCVCGVLLGGVVVIGSELQGVACCAVKPILMSVEGCCGLCED
jgi:hypothetical protein